MRVAVLAAFPLLAVAHDVHRHVARQAPSSTPPASSAHASSTSAASSVSASATPTSVSGAPATFTGPPPTGTLNGTLSANPSLSSPPTVPITLITSNPTAVPLTQIVAGMSSSATIPLATTFTAGSIPTLIPGAPPLPNVLDLVISNYPALDKPPPTDSPEVLQWIQDVQSTGVVIPNISVTTGSASCALNLAAAADTSRCWWTCTGCTRDSDITTCPDPLTWGLTYDDGPAFYTPNLLQYLDQQGIKSTFFVIGSRALEEPVMLQTEFMSGHQIGVHTWSHPPLTTQTNEQIIAEFGWTKKLIKDITGVTPNTFRPPFGDIDDRVRAIATAMGLVPIIWTRLSPQATFDTDDFNIANGMTSVSKVISNFDQIVANATTLSTGFIVLEHDLFQQSVDVATGYILPEALAHQPSFILQPVITCLNKPLSDAYIETNNNNTNPPPVQGSPAVTLSPGAPGSIQATGSSNANAGIPTGGFSGTGLLTVVATSVASVLAGIWVIFI